MPRAKGPTLPYNVLCEDVEQLPRIEWLRLRQSAGIGASEVAAVAGMSPYKTPVDIMMEKTTPILEEDIPLETAYRFEYGHMMERLLHWAVAKLIGATEIRDKRMYQSALYPYMFADLDGLFEMECDNTIQGVFIPKGKQLLYEGKSTTIENFLQWKKEPPIWYVIQCKAAMLVRGLDLALLCIGTGNRLSNDVVYHLVTLTEEDRVAIPELVRYFWEEHALKKSPPTQPIGDHVSAFKKSLLRFYGADSAKNAVKKLSLSTRTALDMAVEIRGELTELAARKKELEEKRDQIELPLVAELGDEYDEGILRGIYSTYYVKYTRRNYDTVSSENLTRLSKDDPELYAQLIEGGYITPSRSSYLTVKKKANKATTKRRRSRG